mmetsp:Transcript_27156/g.59664  ORF Transcript_27156/g.59664 Transcript_27156/m.59664 type:complete len:231 (+) Transcript_27156:1293-1985(+)
MPRASAPRPEASLSSIRWLASSGSSAASTRPEFCIRHLPPRDHWEAHPACSSILMYLPASHRIAHLCFSCKDSAFKASFASPLRARSPVHGCCCVPGMHVTCSRLPFWARPKCRRIDGGQQCRCVRTERRCTAASMDHLAKRIANAYKSAEPTNCVVARTLKYWLHPGVLIGQSTFVIHCPQGISLHLAVCAYHPVYRDHWACYCCIFPPRTKLSFMFPMTSYTIFLGLA